MSRLLVSAPTLALLCALGHGPVATAQRTVADVTPADLTALVRELDALFSGGDVKGYLARFDPDHEGALAMLGEHLARLRMCTGSTQRETQLLAGPRVIGPRALVRLRHTVSWSAGVGSDGVGSDGVRREGQPARAPLVEDSYLAVKRADDGRLVPTFAIEMPSQATCVLGDKFRCPACNYEIGGVEGWLCVPLRRDRTLTLEAATFYLLGTDVACDISVRIEPQVAPAKQAALRMAAAFAKVEPSALVGLAEAWLPPTHAQAPPVGLDGARVFVELPEDQQDRGGQRAIFYLVAFGGLQHVLFVRGSARSLTERAEALDALFASYMLLEEDCDLAEAAARPLRHHLGGVLDGATYQNVRYDVEVVGPTGWRPEQRAGGAAFRVRWTSPGGGQLWLVAHEVPAGVAEWTTAAADLWLQRACEDKQLEPVADGESGWRPVAASGDRAGGMRRTLRLIDGARQDPAAPRRRTLHVQLHADLLLVLDGHGADEAEERAIDAAIDSLRRR